MNVKANMQQKAQQTTDLLTSDFTKEAMNKTIQATQNSQTIAKSQNTLEPSNINAAPRKLYDDVVKAPIAKTQNWMKQKEQLLNASILNVGPIPLGSSTNMTVREGIEATKNSGMQIVGGKDGTEKTKGTGKVQTGGRELSVDEYLKRLDKADEMYESFRKSNVDVQAISKNTGMAEYRIQRIKEHLFFKEHIKEHGVGRFEADYEIAQAWDRLQKRTYKQNDIDLLNHELFESKFECIFKTDYRTAHDRTVDSGRPWYPPEEE